MYDKKLYVLYNFNIILLQQMSTWTHQTDIHVSYNFTCWIAQLFIVFRKRIKDDQIFISVTGPYAKKNFFLKQVLKNKIIFWYYTLETENVFAFKISTCHNHLGSSSVYHSDSFCTRFSVIYSRSKLSQTSCSVTTGLCEDISPLIQNTLSVLIDWLE